MARRMVLGRRVGAVGMAVWRLHQRDAKEPAGRGIRAPHLTATTSDLEREYKCYAGKQIKQGRTAVV